MGRRPGQTCSLCERGVSLKDSGDDGNGGRKCRPSCDARKAADVKAPIPKAAADLIAHSAAVLDFLRPKSAGTSFSPGEIARGSGVLLEEIDAVIKALLASGEIEEMADEEDEDPTYRAKPAEPKTPVEKKPRVNRRGKPTVASEAARTCRVCACHAGAECDCGAGRTCSWTSAETPPGGDLCTVCATQIETAGDLLAAGKAPAEVSRMLYEDSEPCVTEARVAKAIEIAITKKTPTKKTPTKRETKAYACPDRQGPGHCPKHGATCPVPAPAQATLPHSEEARTLTLPMGCEPLAVVPADRGACRYCEVKLTPENSSRLPSGAMKHIGCNAPCETCGSPRGHVANGKPYNPHAVDSSSDLRAPCTDCGAEQGEPCAHATPEPASYIHDARLALLPAEERAVSRRRAAEDRIRVALDEHARIPGDPPVPSRDGLVRALVVPGDFDAFTLRDVLGAMIERGEVRELESDRVPGAKYLRRAPGSTPVVMARVGVRTSEPIVSPEGDDFRDALDLAPSPPEGAESLGDIVRDMFDAGEIQLAPPEPPSGGVDADEHEHVIATLTITPPSTHYAKADGSIVSAAAPIVDESAAEPFALCPQCFACIPKAGDATDDNIAALLSERPDERLAAQLGAAASHVEDLATFVRHAAEALQALRAEARAVSEARTEVESLRVEAALERSRARAAEADRTVLRAGINRAGDVLTRAALSGKIGEGLDAAGLVAELERLAWASVEKEKAGSVKPLRQALHNIVGDLGGELPEEANDEQLCATALERAIAAAKAVRDLASQIDTIAAERDTARSERDIAQGDARAMAGRVMALRAFVAPLAGLPAPHEATDHELIAAAEQHVLPLRAVAEGAIAELTGASATSAKPIAEQLMEAVATFGPRAGDFSTELETAAVFAVHKLTGEPAPMGKGRVAIAEALTAAVEATAAKLAVRRMRVPGATPETGTHTRPRDVF